MECIEIPQGQHSRHNNTGKITCTKHTLYDTPTMYCSAMSGEEVPADWRGALNLTYRIGGDLNTTGWYVILMQES